MAVRTLAFVVLRQVLSLIGLGQSPDTKDVEIAVLRHQLLVLRRQVARPRYTPPDRMVFAALSNALIAAITAILVAVIAASLSYAHARRLQRRQARLGRRNAQLEELYGPLYATLEASRIAYRRLLDNLRPGQSSLFDPDSPPPSEEELRIFRQWVEVVSHPRATRAYDLIISRAHLLVEDEMPGCLLQFLAHKAGYDVLTQRWKDGDVSEHLSVVRQPGDDLYDYLRRSFTQLKGEQAREPEATQGKRLLRCACVADQRAFGGHIRSLPGGEPQTSGTTWCHPRRPSKMTTCIRSAGDGSNC